jgi:hypothetical protein
MFDNELMQTEFPPTRWSVDGLMPDGCVMIAGSEKAGKSCFASGLALDLTHGKPFLGRYATRQGAVLYISKDDVWNGAKTRVGKLLRARSELPTGLLDIQTDWSPFSEGGLRDIEQWLLDWPDASAVILDTLELLAPQKVRYGADYKAIHELSQLGHKYGVAIVCVLHVNKSGFQRGRRGRPWTSDIRGSGTGGADAMLGIDRTDDAPEGTLLIKGKAIEGGAVRLHFETGTGVWSALDEAEMPGETATPALSSQRQRILDLVSAAPDGLRPKQVAERMGETYDNVKQRLWQMAADGQLERFQGSYFTRENLEALNNPPTPQLEFDERPDPTAEDGRSQLVPPIRVIAAA